MVWNRTRMQKIREINLNNYTQKEIGKMAKVFYIKYNIIRKFILLHNFSLYEKLPLGEGLNYNELKKILKKINKELKCK